MRAWRTPAHGLPRGRRGRAEIKDARYDRGLYHAYATGPVLGLEFDYYRLTRPARVTELLVGGETCMVDDPPHWWAMLAHATHYRGHVLVAGLGLGLIVHALAANPAVGRITVVERERDVVDLVGPHLPRGRLEIVHADWYEYDPATPPDGVFYDLLVGDGRELVHFAFREMVRMRERFGGVPIRIHGMCNDTLRAVADAYAAARSLSLSLGQEGGPSCPRPSSGSPS